jgi:uncharacterized protein (DUF362 family)
MSLVSLVKIRGTGKDSIKDSISQSLNLINYSFKKEALNIVIKPNLCYYWDCTTGQTTDPQFVAALIDLIRERVSPDANISIVESDASAMKCKYAFKMLGYDQLSKDYNVPLVNLSEVKCVNANFTAGGQSFRFMVPQIIQNADLKINIPKIKYTSGKIKLTCALKNMYGCNPFPKKYLYHRQLDETIVALNKAMNFNLCLIDGLVVSGVAPRKLFLTMASTDPVAIDAAAAKIAGLNPNTIGHLKLAEKEGLGNAKFVPRGESLDYFARRYPRKSGRKKIMANAYRLLILIKLNKTLGL